MTCEIPSYVAEFVFVDQWTDSDGGIYYPGNGQQAGNRVTLQLLLDNPCPHIFVLDYY